MRGKTYLATGLRLPIIGIVLCSLLSKLLSFSEFWSALTGAVVGGLFAVLVQALSNQAQRKRDRQTERQALLAILQAILAELETLKTDCLDPLRGQLKKSPPGVHATAPVLQNRCSVYESNAAALGKIDNSELLKKIVSVYGQIKGLLDQMNLNYQRFVANTNLLQLRANTDLLRTQQHIQTTGWQAPIAIVETPEVQVAIAELTEIRENMERGLGTLMDNLDPLLEDLRNYIKANSG